MATFKKKHDAYVKRGGPSDGAATQAQFNALVETMVIAACIDGVLAPGESEALASLILDMPTFEKLDNKGLARTVETISERVADEGLDSRVQWIAKTLGKSPSLCE